MLPTKKYPQLNTPFSHIDKTNIKRVNPPGDESKALLLLNTLRGYTKKFSDSTVSQHENNAMLRYN